MPITSPLRHFELREFRHPELVQDQAAVFLDDIRTAYGDALMITSDARTPEENAAASGSSPTSLHLQGLAFDLRYPGSVEHAWRLVEAVMAAANGRGVELELVHSAKDQHVHVALLPNRLAPSRLIVRAD